MWWSHKDLQQSFTSSLLCPMTWIRDTIKCVRLTIKLSHLIGHFICNRQRGPNKDTEVLLRNMSPTWTLPAKVQFSKWSNMFAGPELNDEGQVDKDFTIWERVQLLTVSSLASAWNQTLSKSYPWNRERYITSSHTYTAHHTLVHGYIHVPSS